GRPAHEPDDVVAFQRAPQRLAEVAARTGHDDPHAPTLWPAGGAARGIPVLRLPARPETGVGPHRRRRRAHRPRRSRFRPPRRVWNRTPALSPASIDRWRVFSSGSSSVGVSGVAANTKRRTSSCPPEFAYEAGPTSSN